MVFARCFATIAFIFPLAAQLVSAQGASEDRAAKTQARYELHDVSGNGSPFHIVGYVTFRDNPAVRIRYFYQVEATITNVSKKEVSSLSVRFQTDGGEAPGLNFTYSHDYFFTGGGVVPGESERIYPSPLSFSAPVVNGVPTADSADASTPTATASAEVEFVQFSDGSTWGDRDAEAELFRVRRETKNKLASLRRVYSSQGEKAFIDALAEPTALPCIERVKSDCQNRNGDSSCALEAVEQMLATAERHRMLEKP